MDRIETIRLFHKQGYDLLYEKTLTHIPYYCYSFRGRLRLFNIIDRYFIDKPGAYWVSLFKRK